MSSCAHTSPRTGYHHAALLYDGADAFLAGTVPFVRAAIEADQPTLVVLPKDRIEALRGAIGTPDANVQFADMHAVGSNPARIIPAWQRFVADHPDRTLRGIGEPIFPGRESAELRECQHHERLLNPALEGSDLYLLCPYDTGAMSADVIDEARRSHPILVEEGRELRSDEYLGMDANAGMLHEPLPPPPATAASLPCIGVDDLAMAREFVETEARKAALPTHRRMDLVLAVNELITNSLRHGDRPASVSVWREPETIVAEVRGGGQIENALVDRTAAAPTQPGNRGLWLANQVCDLVQLRSLDDRVVGRVFIRIP